MTAPPRQSLDLAHARTLYGLSAGFWASGGRHVVEDGRWLAFTGVPNVGLNTALCHGAAGAQLLPDTLAVIKALRIPAAISVAGEALGAVNVLGRASWVCVGASPLMTRPLDDLPDEPHVRMLATRELPAARLLVSEAFSLPVELSAAGLPDSAAETDGFAVWGLFAAGEMVSCMGTAMVEDVAVVWSMATPARLQRRGYARRLLFGALAQVRAHGATTCLLSASAVGESLYLAAGFAVLERWQMWSRPRWLLADD
jgi:GNAT superfamily N-acetyltransferase